MADAKPRRVGQARFERRPTNLAFNDGDVQLVGRRGEAPLVPPYYASGVAILRTYLGSEHPFDAVQVRYELR